MRIRKFVTLVEEILEDGGKLAAYLRPGARPRESDLLGVAQEEHRVVAEAGHLVGTMPALEPDLDVGETLELASQRGVRLEVGRCLAAVDAERGGRDHHHRHAVVDERAPDAGSVSFLEGEIFQIPTIVAP